MQKTRVVHVSYFKDKDLPPVSQAPVTPPTFIEGWMMVLIIITLAIFTGL